jgi:hypothetical protein
VSSLIKQSAALTFTFGAVPQIVQLGNVPKYDLFAIAHYSVKDYVTALKPFASLAMTPPDSGGSGLPVALANEVCDSGIRARQRLFIRQEHNAEVLCAGLLAKTRAVDHHDMFLAD